MKHRIIVLGAGYTGAFAAGRLARRLHPDDVHLTLVNAEPDFVERVRSHQLATGQRLKHRPLAAMYAGTGVELVIAKVASMDVDRRTVSVTGPDGPRELEYDTLVYALGSGWNPQGVPGTAEHAYEIASRPGALRLRDRLARLGTGAPVTVVGGGLTGVEAVTELAESRPDLHVAIAVRGEYGDWLSPKARAHLRKVTRRLGIAVHEHAAVTEVGPDSITTADGREIPAAATVWTAGFAVHPFAETTTLELAADGRIVVDAQMASVSHPDVYAVGDTGYAIGDAGTPLRMSCASGNPMAWIAADAIVARLTGATAKRPAMHYTQQCISLGRKEGLVQFVTPDDRPKDSAMHGRTAALYKEFICKAAAWAPANPTFYLPARRHRVAHAPARQGSTVN
ncbi:NAD(P)/FAD-dependent oxidoreductase [Glycomyces dulcitolivorans]|uniref:NAD(P)/FAD-dependent oxidoreductase n=1 Tax=Glycomyces dulcitolivorans TaxID=2200759 RepID=UPI000DD3EF6E|nr:FAD-dependent oxidoreductase [Glycomyces dulcitolivorans]